MDELIYRLEEVSRRLIRETRRAIVFTDNNMLKLIIRIPRVLNERDISGFNYVVKFLVDDVYKEKVPEVEASEGEVKVSTMVTESLTCSDGRLRFSVTGYTDDYRYSSTIATVDLKETISLEGRERPETVEGWLETIREAVKAAEKSIREKAEGSLEAFKKLFVEKEEGRGLSSNDYTSLEKDKLAGVEDGAEVNAIETIKRNGEIVEPIDKAVDIRVPGALSELENDTGFKSEAEVIALVEAHGKLKRAVVESLPELSQADENTMYLVKAKDGKGYEEYLVVEGAWELLGASGEVDLSGVLKEEDLEVMTKEEAIELYENA